MTLIKRMLTTTQARQKQSFAYAREIQKAFGAIDEIIHWCKSELSDEWRWELIQPSSDIVPGRYIFYFDSDRDACAFALKWA
jgi:hypothetical protein